MITDLQEAVIFTGQYAFAKKNSKNFKFYAELFRYCENSQRNCWKVKNRRFLKIANFNTLAVIYSVFQRSKMKEVEDSEANFGYFGHLKISLNISESPTYS